jgi:PilZ domain
MDPVKAKFFHASMLVEFQGNSIEMKGLVSETGVTKIFMGGNSADAWKSVVGEKVTVILGPVTLQGNLLQQFVEHGTFYEIRFFNVDEPIRDYLRQRVQAEGVNPGWQRQFPRIPVKGLDDPELKVPNLCMVRFVGQEIFANVVNFTLGGIRIETLGDSLNELRVGALLHFDLVTSNGEVLANMGAEVRNIAVHDRGSSGGSHLTRSFGLRFVDMNPVNERRYRELIRNFCVVLQKRYGQIG